MLLLVTYGYSSRISASRGPTRDVHMSWFLSALECDPYEILKIPSQLRPLCPRSIFLSSLNPLHHRSRAAWNQNHTSLHIDAHSCWCSWHIKYCDVHWFMCCYDIQYIVLLHCPECIPYCITIIL